MLYCVDIKTGKRTQPPAKSANADRLFQSRLGDLQPIESVQRATVVVTDRQRIPRAGNGGAQRGPRRVVKAVLVFHLIRLTHNGRPGDGELTSAYADAAQIRLRHYRQCAADIANGVIDR